MPHTLNRQRLESVFLPGILVSQKPFSSPRCPQNTWTSESRLLHTTPSLNSTSKEQVAPMFQIKFLWAQKRKGLNTYVMNPTVGKGTGPWKTGPAPLGLPRWLSGKESTCQCRRRSFDPWVEKIPWRMKWQSTLVSLPEKAHVQRSLVGYIAHGVAKSRIWLRD